MFFLQKKDTTFLLLCLCYLITAIVFIFKLTVVESYFVKPYHIGDPYWQHDSEAFVVGKIIKDKGQYNIYTKESNNKGNLLILSDEKNRIPDNVPSAMHELLLSGGTNKQLFPLTYNSQYGLQGKFFGFLYTALNLHNLQLFYIVHSIVFAFIIFCISWEYYKLDAKLGIAFWLTMLLSPWIIAYSRNLYWVFSLYFAPALFSLYFYRFIHKKYLNFFFFFLTFFSFVIKCLCGYEFISTVILFAALNFVVIFFLPQRTISKKTCVKYFFVVCMLGVLGFASALIIHADTRGESISEGLSSIYHQDILRRTHGDPKKYPHTELNSLGATTLETIDKYIFYHTQLFSFVINPPGLRILALLAVLCIGQKIVIRDVSSIRDSILFLYSLLIPLSWIVLAKGHSYVHTFMNFVLWYFGFIPICVYIIFDRLVFFAEEIRKVVYLLTKRALFILSSLQRYFIFFFLTKFNMPKKVKKF